MMRMEEVIRNVGSEGLFSFLDYLDEGNKGTTLYEDGNTNYHRSDYDRWRANVWAKK